MERTADSILYRANRLWFAIAALFIVPATVLIAWLCYSAVTGESVNGAFLLPTVLVLYLVFSGMIAVKLIWPPEIEVSLGGVRWLNRTSRGSGSYGWDELDGPSERSSRGVPLLMMRVRATGQQLEYPPSHFGATYAEMEAVMNAARDGQLIDPVRWRIDHPQHLLRHWLVDWGLPILAGVALIALKNWLDW